MEDPSAMTPAERRCLREHLGFTARSFAVALSIDERTVHRWETTARPMRESHAEKIRRLIDHTNDTVERLAADTPAGGLIVTYETDAVFHQAEPPSGWTLPAAWHRAVAWQAAQRTGCRVAFSGHDETAPASGEGSGGR